MLDLILYKRDMITCDETASPFDAYLSCHFVADVRTMCAGKISKQRYLHDIVPELCTEHVLAVAWHDSLPGVSGQLVV